MNLICKKLNTSVKNFMRACGYTEIINPHNREISYARSLDPGRFYPRFHIYIEERPHQTAVNLHFDAKQPSYSGTTAHGGEYEGPVVEKEAQRIKEISEKFVFGPPAEKPLGFEKESWFKRLFSFFRKK